MGNRWVLTSAIGVMMSVIPAWADAKPPGTAENEQAHKAFANHDPKAGVQLFLKAAELGNVDAEVQVAEFYDDGSFGVPVDFSKAMFWYLKASAQGSAAADFKIASLYREGKGVPVDFQKAHDWYAKTIAANETGALVPEATRYLKMMDETLHPHPAPAPAPAPVASPPVAPVPSTGAAEYAQGSQAILDHDEKTAVMWIQRAAALGNRDGEYQLGSFYRFGYGMKLDPSQAMYWYQKAAAQGSELAALAIADLYREGQGVPVDLQMARDWYTRSIAEGLEFPGQAIEYIDEIDRKLHPAHAGDAPPGTAELLQARKALQANDRKAAFEWAEKSAKLGNWAAEIGLGELYETGVAGHPVDYVKAMSWYRLAAAYGVDIADFRIAELYRNGKGVPVDYAKAEERYQKSSGENAHADELTPAVAQAILDMRAKMPGHAEFDKGDLAWSVKRYQEACKAFQAAASLGNRNGEEGVARCYLTGSGLAQNDVEARRWYQKALDHGDVWAYLPLADLLWNGRGGPKDEGQAQTLYKRAMYLNVNGAADAWAELAERQGDVDANGDKNIWGALSWYKESWRAHAQPGIDAKVRRMTAKVAEYEQSHPARSTYEEPDMYTGGYVTECKVCSNRRPSSGNSQTPVTSTSSPSATPTWAPDNSWKQTADEQVKQGERNNKWAEEKATRGY